MLIRFGECILDLETAELLRDGGKITLQDQPFAVLRILIENPNQLVTREDLVKRLWPEGTFVDFDQSLNKAVARLREALGDDADQPRFVQTLPRRGYRWIATVRTVETAISSRHQASLSFREAQLSNEVARSLRSPDRGLHPLASYVLATVITLLAMAAVWAIARRHFAASGAVKPIRSLAVLPFENLSQDTSDEYFVDGMTDELITDLAVLPQVRVISRTSSMQYKNTRKAAPQIARELNVDGIIEGSVMHLGDRVRIRVQLIYAPHDQHLWAAAYERSVENILDLQATAALDIVRELKVQLTGQQMAQISRTRVVSPEAYELYLKGRYFWNKRDETGLTKAIEYFRQAIAKDNGYAVAYAGLADAYILLYGYAPSPPSGALENAKVAAEQALYLDETLAEAHSSLALLSPYYGWNWSLARKHYERALELNPGYATAHHWYGDAYLEEMGRLDEALAEIRQARDLDPLSAIIATDLGKALIFARKYDQAIAQLRQTLEIYPDFALAHYWLFYAYTEKGEYTAARRELDKSSALLGFGRQLAERAFLTARSGDRRQALKMMAQVEAIARHTYVNPSAMAYGYIALGDNERAFFWLEKGYRNKLPFMGSLKVVPALDPIRSDPRFSSLVRRLGLD